MYGIIGAMDCEIAVLRDLIEDGEVITVLNRDFIKGHINNNEVVLVCSGVGKVNAAITTEILITQFKATKVINLGVAGGVLPLKPLDLVISDKLCYHDFDVRVFNYEMGFIPGYKKYFEASKELIDMAIKIADENNFNYHVGLIASGDQFMTDSKILKRVDENVISAEMEGAAIAHVCDMHNTDFLVLRCISDILDSKDQEISFQLVEEEAAKIAGIFIKNILKNN